MEGANTPPGSAETPGERNSTHTEAAGLAASPGIGIGVARHLDRQPIPVSVFHVDDVYVEKARYRTALHRIEVQLNASAAEAESRFGPDESRIYRAQAALLTATLFQKNIPKMILQRGINAEAVIREQIWLLQDKSHLQPGGSPAPGISDITDILQQISQVLIHDNPRCLIFEKNTVLVADELLPSDMILIDRNAVIGLISEGGAPYSHAAIMARSMGIPAVMGAPNAMSSIPEGERVIVDGTRGRVLIRPDNSTVDLYTRQIIRDRTIQDEQKALSSLPSVSTDGVTVTLLANARRPEDIRDVIESGAGGIGLFRTELPFLMGAHFVSEQEQLELYRRVVEGMNGLPVIFRTLDVGGDKLQPGSMGELEANPFLGLRSVRYSLKHPDLLTVQLRALIRAAVCGPVDIMFPMVTTLGEMDLLTAHVHRVIEELKEEGVAPERTPSIGVMIETPSAAVCAQRLFSRVAFASIGTNDLIQYLLAVDRTNRDVNHLYSPWDPAVLATIRNVAEAAKRTGTELSICGEAAADPLCAVVFASFGIPILSMDPSSLFGVKRAVRAVNLSEIARVVREAMELDDAVEIRQYLADRIDISPSR